jgi:hypothetical protein
VYVSEGATTEHTDSDTRTQRERNTHRTHTRGCVWECQRPDVRGQIIPGQRADGRRGATPGGGATAGHTKGIDSRSEVWKSSTPPQTVMVWCLFLVGPVLPLLLALGLA